MYKKAVTLPFLMTHGLHKIHHLLMSKKHIFLTPANVVVIGLLKIKKRQQERIYVLYKNVVDLYHYLLILIMIVNNVDMKPVRCQQTQNVFQQQQQQHNVCVQDQSMRARERNTCGWQERAHASCGRVLFCSCFCFIIFISF